MEVFSLVWDFLFGTFIRMHNYLDTWYQHVTEAGFVVSQGSMILILFFVIIFCGSSMTAMTFAELKNRKRWLHGIIGFIVPIAYPAVLYFLMPKIGVDEESEESETGGESASEDSVPDSELKAYSDGKGDSTEAIAASGVMDQSYFLSIATDENGNKCGPFVLEFYDGQMLEIEYVIEALPNAVAIQMGEGEAGKTIRLPYERIKNCKSRQIWLDESEIQSESEKEELEMRMSEEEGD